MLDLIDTLNGTVKPDYRSAKTLAYRMSKPVEYYTRQCKVKKAKPGEYPAKPLGPKELPGVEALLEGVIINKWGQIFSCGWYLGDKVVSRGETVYGFNKATFEATIEDCVERFHAKITEERAKTAKVAAPKLARLVTGKLYNSPDEVIGKNIADIRHCLAKLGNQYIGCSAHSMPIKFDSLLASENGVCWSATKLTSEYLKSTALGNEIVFPVVKGATHYGVFNGKLGAWMVNKERECVKLFEGCECSLGFDWVCRASVLFAYNGGRVPKQESFTVKLPNTSHGHGLIVGPDWVVLPINITNAGIALT